MRGAPPLALTRVEPDDHFEKVESIDDAFAEKIIEAASSRSILSPRSVGAGIVHTSNWRRETVFFVNQSPRQIMLNFFVFEGFPDFGREIFDKDGVIVGEQFAECLGCIIPFLRIVSGFLAIVGENFHGDVSVG